MNRLGTDEPRSMQLVVDDHTFREWARALPGLPLPLRLPLRPDAGADAPVTGRSVVVPPIAAASLALHGGAVVTVLIWLETRSTQTSVALSVDGDLGASLLRIEPRTMPADSGGHPEPAGRTRIGVGLFLPDDLVEQAVREVPAVPEPGSLLRLMVLGPDGSPSSWVGLLVPTPDPSGEQAWCWMPARGEAHHPLTDVRAAMAAELRFAVAGSLDAAAVPVGPCEEAR